MNSISQVDEPIHIVSPLQHSVALSKLLPAGTEVYMKQENTQPASSFKIRGISRLAQKVNLSLATLSVLYFNHLFNTQLHFLSQLKKDGYQRLIGASGGNAGLAISHASQIIGIPCTVYVPTTAPMVTIQMMKDKGAEVKKPSALVVSVGGGGLLLGILQGLQNVGWQDVPVVAMETYGANCFNLAVQAKAVVVLEKITSSVPPYLLEVIPNFNVISRVVSDPEALESCIKFADDERILVEPACGASLAAIYSGVLEDLHSKGIVTLTAGPVVVVVCGGAGVSLKMLQDWAKQLNVKFPS
ncbi:L-serine dehydratase/L-threonine deaminase [Blattella germanica]|nr:L-serine dehydratase/L-threonine deaminase [Blattella germanica]